MVGDTPEDDIEGARAVGIRAFLIDRDGRYPRRRGCPISMPCPRLSASRPLVAIERTLEGHSRDVAGASDHCLTAVDGVKAAVDGSGGVHDQQVPFERSLSGPPYAAAARKQGGRRDMFKSMAGIVALAAALLAMIALSAGSASAAPQSGACQKDSKLIGPILLSTEDAPDTWWGITKAGLEAAGIVGDDAQKENIEEAFGTTFASLDEAVAALVDAVRPLDKNGNEYVCASSVRGTRAVLGDPNWAFYYFGVIDDKHVKS